MLHQFGNNGTSFSIFFPISGSREAMEEGGSYTSSSYTSPSSSSSVDCTLSLGPPSSSGAAPERSAAPSFCWDIISQSKATTTTTTHHPSVAAASRVTPAPNNAASNNMGGDPLLLARRCANCDTTSTPLWRNGPRGPKSLCNACGIRYKKEERRAAASTAAPSSAAGHEAVGYSTYQRQQQQQQQQQQNSSWGCYNPNSTAAHSGRDDDMEQVPYLSWRLNVVPQPTSLFQYQ